MATPHADRLHKMEAWRTSAMEDSHRHLTAVSQALVEIAAGNREVAADLGLEGATGQAARASFDRLARRMIKASDRLKQIVKASTEALTAGIDARNESIEIQTKLKTVNDGFEHLEKTQQVNGGLSAPGISGAGVTAAEIEAKRQAAHAKIDALAKKSLSKLNGRILAAIDTLPPDGRTGQTTAHAGSRDTRPGNERVGDGPAAGQNTGPARSATAWAASVDTSLGAPGRHAPDGGHGSAAGGSGPTSGGGPAAGPIGGGVSLQGTHYAPPASGATAPSNPSVGAAGHSPAVFNPLASAAAVGGGAAVAGYRAYQAARPVQTPAYRPSAVRAAGAAPTPSARSAGIVRGATTAARAQTTTTGSTAAGRSSGSVRGGATGIARPAPAQASARSSGIPARHHDRRAHADRLLDSLGALLGHLAGHNHRRAQTHNRSGFSRAARRTHPRTRNGLWFGGAHPHRRTHTNHQLIPKHRLLPKDRHILAPSRFIARGRGRSQRLNRRQALPARHGPSWGPRRIGLAGPAQPDRKTRQRQEGTPPSQRRADPIDCALRRRQNRHLPPRRTHRQHQPSTPIKQTK